MKYYRCSDSSLPNPFYRDTGKRIEYRCEHSKEWKTSFGSREGMAVMVNDGFMVEIEAA